jgi:hypothetical protein
MVSDSDEPASRARRSAAIWSSNSGSWSQRKSSPAAAGSTAVAVVGEGRVASVVPLTASPDASELLAARTRPRVTAIQTKTTTAAAI